MTLRSVLNTAIEELQQGPLPLNSPENLTLLCVLQGYGYEQCDSARRIDSIEIQESLVLIKTRSATSTMPAGEFSLPISFLDSTDLPADLELARAIRKRREVQQKIYSARERFAIEIQALDRELASIDRRIDSLR